MNFYLVFSKRNLLATLLATVIIIFTLGQVYSAANVPKNAETNALRLNYISSLNYKVEDETPTEKQITIPVKFNKVYNKYNELQKEAGFNLEDYCGQNVTMFTYKLKDNYYANIIVLKGRIIGGDICSNSLYGEMLPLKKRQSL